MPAQRLRDYQREGLSNALEAWRAGARLVLLVLATGGGKTTIFGELTSQLFGAGRHVVIIVHRRELAKQAANRLREFGVDFGFVMPGWPERPSARVQVCMVQTLARRRRFPRADLVVCDEAHLSTANTWQTVIDNYPRARVLGVTATPWRLGGRPLAGTYDEVVVVATTRELIKRGFLCPYVGFSYLAPDLSEVKSTGGDYNEGQSAKAMRAPQIVDNIVEQWLAHASTLSTVVFAVTVEHSKELCARFLAAGVKAEHLDGKTPTLEREAILKRVDSGATMVLCNVGVAVEGLDIPRLKCCVLARPTMSLSKALQMPGRVLRPWRPDGRECSPEYPSVVARIHDHAFNIRKHGLPDAERDYSLDAPPEQPPSMTECPVCKATYSGNICPGCGETGGSDVTERGEISTVADAEQFSFAAGEDLPAGPQADPEPRNERPVDVRWDTPGRKVDGKLVKTWNEPTAYGSQRMYLVRGVKRDFRLRGTTHLNALLSQVPIPDSWVSVVYVEDKALSGGRSKKLFRVEVDDEK